MKYIFSEIDKVVDDVEDFLYENTTYKECRNHWPNCIAFRLDVEYEI